MTVRPLLRYPDTALKQPALPVAIFDEKLRQLADDLLDTMRAAPGIGITASHVGVPIRVTVLELEDGKVDVYVNPVIVEASAEMIMHREGSVSMPGMHEDVERHKRIRITFQDLDGIVHEEESEDLRAVCHQHEIDQMDGIFWIQRLSRLKRDRLIKKYEKSLRAAGADRS